MGSLDGRDRPGMSAAEFSHKLKHQMSAPDTSWLQARPLPATSAKPYLDMPTKVKPHRRPNPDMMQTPEALRDTHDIADRRRDTQKQEEVDRARIAELEALLVETRRLTEADRTRAASLEEQNRTYARQLTRTQAELVDAMRKIDSMKRRDPSVKTSRSVSLVSGNSSCG